ncbi:MAG: hypothetical protein AAFU53_11580 [Cyanobacteria bacterium J06632_3]
MPAFVKSFLPAVITASPLILAAAPLPAPDDAMQLSCELSSEPFPESMATRLASGQRGIAHPIAASPQPLVTSAQEWTAIWRGSSTQHHCNTKEEPAGTSAPSSDVPADEIPNLDPSALPPASNTPDVSESEPSTGSPPESIPDGNEEVTAPAAPSPSPASEIRARPVSPQPADPTIDPTNVTPTSEPATPFDGVVIPTLEELPDGVYRYLAGNYEYGIYTNEQLIANGGAVFLLTKAGDSVVGNFYPKFGQAGVCIDGTVSGNSVVGPAYVLDSVDLEEGDERLEVGDAYEAYAGIATLQVRQPSTVGDRIAYGESLLDLSEYSRINSGTSLAPTECDVPITETADTSSAE